MACVFQIARRLQQLKCFKHELFYFGFVRGVSVDLSFKWMAMCILNIICLLTTFIHDGWCSYLPSMHHKEKNTNIFTHSKRQFTKMSSIILMACNQNVKLWPILINCGIAMWLQNVLMACVTLHKLIIKDEEGYVLDPTIEMCNVMRRLTFVEYVEGMEEVENQHAYYKLRECSNRSPLGIERI